MPASTPLRSALAAAIDSFVDEVVKLLPDNPVAPRVATVREERHRNTVRRVRAETAPPVPPVEQSPVVVHKPAPQAPPARVANQIAIRPTDPMMTALQMMLRGQEPERPKGPTQEQLVDRIVEMVWAADSPLVFERIRLALRVKSEVLAPLLQQLVAENRVRAVDLDGTQAYKPPRIEPIRRRRPNAA